MCVDGVIPDNFNACDPTLPPPAAVLSLDWDTAADLDLAGDDARRQAGRRQAPLHRAAGAGAAAVAAAGVPATATRRPAAAPSAARRENLIWQKPPAPGSYLIRVNMFDACGAANARFTVTLYTASAADGRRRRRRSSRGSNDRLVARAAGQRRRGIRPLHRRRRVLKLEEREGTVIEQLLKVALLGSTWVLYLLVALSVISLAAMVERWLFFRRHRDDTDALRAAVSQGAARRRSGSAARELVAKSRVARGAACSARRWRWWDGGPEAVADAVESELGARAEAARARHDPARHAGQQRAVHRPARHGASASSRRSTSSSAGASKAAMGNVMGGIAEALVATGVGLFVALPAVVAYNVIQKRIGEIESRRTPLAQAVHRVPEDAGRTPAVAPATIELVAEPAAPDLALFAD